MKNPDKINTREYSDEELVRGCVRQERAFQKMLYYKFASKMYGICLSFVGDRELAQDILQDGFIKVFNFLKTFDMNGSLEGWIRKTMVNTSIDYYRKKAKLQQYIVSDSIFQDEEIPEEILDRIQTEEILNKVSELPEGARLIFNLYAVEGYSHKEIAEMLNISIGTSKSQLSRAKSLLKSWLTHNT